MILFSLAVANIIHLEDEAPTAELVKAALTREGYSVEQVLCAQKMLDRVRLCDFDPGQLYILDHINVSDSNPNHHTGGYVAQEILDRDPNARVIIATGNPVTYLPESIQQAVQKGQVGFLQKPFRTKQLQDLVELYHPAAPSMTYDS